MEKKIKNTKLYERLISSGNIYLSIYSLDSYIFNKELLSDEDKNLMDKLKDKFNETCINDTIEKVRKRLEKLVLIQTIFWKYMYI